MKRHLIYLIICLPLIFFVSCDNEKKNETSGELSYDALFQLRPEIANRLDTAKIGITDGTYPAKSYAKLEEALADLDEGISKARANYFILQFEVDNYVLAAQKAINMFEDARVLNLAPGTLAELFVNGVDHNGWIDFGSSPDFCGGSKFTVETWVKYDEGYLEFPFGSFISTFVSPMPYKGWTLNFWGITGTTLRFNLGADEQLPEAAMQAPTDYGTWHHIAAVYNSSEKKAYLYLDGVLKGSCDVPKDMVPNAADDMRMWAFVEPKDHSRCMSGYIKKFRIWSVAKTQDEVSLLMNSDVTGSEQGLVCAWDFTERVQDDKSIPDKTGRHTAKIEGIFRWKPIE